MRFAKHTWILFAITIIGTGWVSIGNAFKPKPVKFVTPKGWPQPAYDFSKNPLTEEGFFFG